MTLEQVLHRGSAPDLKLIACDKDGARNKEPGEQADRDELHPVRRRDQKTAQHYSQKQPPPVA